MRYMRGRKLIATIGEAAVAEGFLTGIIKVACTDRDGDLILRFDLDALARCAVAIEGEPRTPRPTKTPKPDVVIHHAGRVRTNGRRIHAVPKHRAPKKGKPQ